jgi:hypothetical protein
MSVDRNKFFLSGKQEEILRRSFPLSKQHQVQVDQNGFVCVCKGIGGGQMSCRFEIDLLMKENYIYLH